MSKKIYDILPPKVVGKIEQVSKSLSSLNKPAKNQQRGVVNGQKRIYYRRILFIGGAAVILLVGYLVIFRLPKAEIQIWPTLDTLTLEDKITADKSFGSIDLLKKTIPAEYIEVEKEGQQEFEATGISSTNSKASGTIKIYNKMSPAAPVTLILGTRFLSNSGKYFVTLSKVTIPAAKGNSSGSIDVKVQAQDAGPDSNIGPSKFSVPKLAGTSYYYGIWGESFGKMTGGSLGTVKKVTQDDINKAKDSLVQELFSQAQESLKEKLSEDDVLLNYVIIKDTINATSDVKSGSTIDKFTESAKVKISALTFKKQDMDKIVDEIINIQLGDSRGLFKESLLLDYSPELIDIDNGSQTIGLKISGKTYHLIDKDNLINSVEKKSADGIKDVIDSLYGDKVSEIKINFWPWWVNKAPSNHNRIEVQLNFNSSP